MEDDLWPSQSYNSRTMGKCCVGLLRRKGEKEKRKDGLDEFQKAYVDRIKDDGSMNGERRRKEREQYDSPCMHRHARVAL